MKKTAALMLCGVLAAGMLTGCGGKDGEGKTFTVGFDAEFPPYGYADENGEYTGFDLEMAQAVCDLEGWELVKQPVDWDRSEERRVGKECL